MRWKFEYSELDDFPAPSALFRTKYSLGSQSPLPIPKFDHLTKSHPPLCNSSPQSQPQNMYLFYREH